MAKWSRCSSESEFPSQPAYLAWRYAGGRLHHGQCALYPNLSLLKAAVTNDCGYDDKPRHTWKIYEFAGEWTLIYEIPEGVDKKQHELWRNGPAPKTSQVASEDDVQAAIESILKSRN